MRIVIALGGNALLKRGQAMSQENQLANVRTAAEAIAPLVAEHEVVITHGNGPQVGLLSLQSHAYERVEPYSLDVLGAETEGMIGYMLEMELGNLLPAEQPLATILTMIEVDPNDPAFGDPTKFVGPIYEQAQAEQIAEEKGWVIRRPTATTGAGSFPRRLRAASSRSGPFGGCSTRAWSSSVPAAAAFQRLIQRPVASACSKGSKPLSTRISPASSLPGSSMLICSSWLPTSMGSIETGAPLTRAGSTS